MTTLLSADLAPLDAEEQAEAMAHDALVYDLSVVLMRLDGNDGDPHQLLWTGGTVPEPWGDAWQRYEEQAQAVLNAIGEGSARALVEKLRTAASGVGVVAPRQHKWDASGERCTVCGDKDWMGGECSGPAVAVGVSLPRQEVSGQNHQGVDASGFGEGVGRG